jgi:hypothetical protein
MIIGIDEVGNFVYNSDIKFHFFTAVKIDQNNNGYEIKKAQFQKWFESIPIHKKNKNGEIKGTDLTEEELYNFADTVIAADPPVRIVQVKIIPSNNPPELIEEFQRIEVKRLENLIKIYKEKNRNILAKQYTKLAAWYKNRSYAQYLKIIILNHTICEALRSAIGTSILLGLLHKDDNLLNIKFKIDRDFINGDEPKIFWRDFLRSAFRDYSKKYPIPMLDQWEKTGHSFLTKYGRPDGQIDFKEILRGNTDFHHSHEHFEIQMADIAGTIYHRFQNRSTCKEAYDKLVEPFSGKKHTMVQIDLNRNPNNSEEVIMA